MNGVFLWHLRMPESRAKGWRSRRKPRWYFHPVNGLFPPEQVLNGEFPRARFVPCVQWNKQPDRLYGVHWAPRLFLVKKENPNRSLVGPDGLPTSHGRTVAEHEVSWEEFAKQLKLQGLVVGVDKYFSARVFYDRNRPKQDTGKGGIDASIDEALGHTEESAEDL
jgi:hypothetical protein